MAFSEALGFTVFKTIVPAKAHEAREPLPIKSPLSQPSLLISIRPHVKVSPEYRAHRIGTAARVAGFSLSHLPLEGHLRASHPSLMTLIPS